MSISSNTARNPLGLARFAALLTRFTPRAVETQRAALPASAPAESAGQPSVRHSVADFFRFLTDSSERREWKRREAYLAQSTSLSDLEHRMRELDRRTPCEQPAWMLVQ